MEIDIKRLKVNIMCNIKKHQPYLDLAYEELQILNFVQSDE